MEIHIHDNIYKIPLTSTGFKLSYALTLLIRPRHAAARRQRNDADHHGEEQEHNGRPGHTEELTTSSCHDPIGFSMAVDEINKLHGDDGRHRGRDPETDEA